MNNLYINMCMEIPWDINTFIDIVLDSMYIYDLVDRIIDTAETLEHDDIILAIKSIIIDEVLEDADDTNYYMKKFISQYFQEDINIGDIDRLDDWVNDKVLSELEGCLINRDWSNLIDTVLKTY